MSLPKRKEVYTYEDFSRLSSACWAKKRNAFSRDSYWWFIFTKLGQ